MTEHQDEQRERIATMRQDADLRQQQQASTLHQHAQIQADELSQGRFRATGTPIITGITAVPAYPAGPNWSATQLPDEPPLGVSVNDQEAVGTLSEVQQSLERLGEAGLPSPSQPNGGAVVAPASSSPPCADVCETAAPPTFNDDDKPPPRAA